MKIGEALRAVTRLGVDTSPFVYFVEASPTYIALCREVFRQVSRGTIRSFTSILTLSETLVHPLRTGDTVTEQKYTDLLLHTAGVMCLVVDADVALRTADLRARHRLRTPDAIQVATALHAGCEAFLTNDSNLKRVTELRILTLSDLTL